MIDFLFPKLHKEGYRFLAIASVTDASNYVLASADTIAADATLTYTYINSKE